MNRVVIFGNSGSGKSTLARSYSANLGAAHLDLDSIAWATAGVRKEVAESIKDLESFVGAHESWVIEGCYGSLIRAAAASASEMYFLNPSIEECQQNCRTRPWEPHKYETEEAQEENLEMLLEWVANYETRNDEFSLQEHRAIFESFRGKKEELKSNIEAQRLALESAPRFTP